jgi:hypothetical protein
LFKNQSAGVAEIGLVLPQAVLNSGRVGNVASAKPEGVGRARGPLLGRDSPAQRLLSHKAMLPPPRYSDVWFSKSYLITPLIGLGFRSEAGLRKKPGFQRLAALTKS